MAPYATPDGRLSATDLANRFGISRMTVTRWRLSGGLPPCVAKNPFLWLEKDVDRWEAAGLLGFDRNAAERKILELQAQIKAAQQAAKVKD
jgi:hypothetical protein